MKLGSGASSHGGTDLAAGHMVDVALRADDSGRSYPLRMLQGHTSEPEELEKVSPHRALVHCNSISPNLWINPSWVCYGWLSHVFPMGGLAA